MKIVADTNWLVAAYFVNVDLSRTDIVIRFADHWDVAWRVPRPVLLEAQNVFAAYAGKPNGDEWITFQGDVGTKLFIPELGWNELLATTEELCDRFSHKTRLGTLDLMILASALRIEATHFLSFDTDSSTRALAAHLKLKVFPDLTAEDKRRMALFR
jgi:hypothetical protein